MKNKKNLAFIKQVDVDISDNAKIEAQDIWAISVFVWNGKGRLMAQPHNFSIMIMVKKPRKSCLHPSNSEYGIFLEKGKQYYLKYSFSFFVSL